MYLKQQAEGCPLGVLGRAEGLGHAEGLALRAFEVAVHQLACKQALTRARPVSCSSTRRGSPLTKPTPTYQAHEVLRRHLLIGWLTLREDLI